MNMTAEQLADKLQTMRADGFIAAARMLRMTNEFARKCGYADSNAAAIDAILQTERKVNGLLKAYEAQK